MLECVEAEVDDVRRVAVVQDAEDTAFFLEFVEHRRIREHGECRARGSGCYGQPVGPHSTEGLR